MTNSNRLDNTEVRVLINIPDPTGVGLFANRGEDVLVVVKMQETSFCKNKKGLTAIVPNYHLALR